MDREDESCSICFDSYEFRVLQCGHAFCLECLNTLYYKGHDGKIRCPMDRMEDMREPISLPTPQQFRGQIFMPALDGARYQTLNQLLDAQVQHRMQTIRQLRSLATTLNGQEFNCSIAKITGSAAGIAGSIMAIIGGVLSMTKAGKSIGVPLAMAGAGIGIAGGATTGTAITVEQVLQKNGIKEVQKDLILDNFKAEQIKILLMRAANNPLFAEKWNINSVHLATIGRLLPGLAKVGVTTAAGIRVALGAGRAAATAGLHIAGLVLAASAIPLDIAQLVVSSIKVHKKGNSKVVENILGVADRLEKELRINLIQGEQLKCIYTNDGQWLYIAVYAQKLREFESRLSTGFTMQEVRNFGDVVEIGEGEIPDLIKKKVQDEWYFHYDEHIAEAMQEEMKAPYM